MIAVAAQVHGHFGGMPCSCLFLRAAERSADSDIIGKPVKTHRWKSRLQGELDTPTGQVCEFHIRIEPCLDLASSSPPP
jgi:hypothetical protein